MNILKLKRFYEILGSIGEPLGIIGVKFLFRGFVSREVIENALRMLSWNTLTPEKIAGASLLFSLFVTLPLGVICFATLGNTGLWIYLGLVISLGGYFYQLVDEMAFRFKYDFTFYTPIALEIMAIELLKTGNKDKAIENLVRYNLGAISFLVNINVVRPYKLKKIYPSLTEKFLDWLHNECPSELFRHYASQLLSFKKPNEKLFNELISDVQTTVFSILEDKMTSSASKTQLALFIIVMISTMATLMIAFLGNSVRIDNPIFIGVTLGVFYVLDIPLLIYDIMAPRVRGLYIIEELKL